MAGCLCEDCRRHGGLFEDDVGGKKCWLERLVAVMLQIRWGGGMSERAAEVSVPTVAVGYARLNAFALDSSTFPLMFRPRELPSF